MCSLCFVLVCKRAVLKFSVFLVRSMENITSYRFGATCGQEHDENILISVSLTARMS